LIYLARFGACYIAADEGILHPYGYGALCTGIQLPTFYWGLFSPLHLLRNYVPICMVLYPRRMESLVCCIIIITIIYLVNSKNFTHCRIYVSPALYLILSQLNLFYSLPSYFHNTGSYCPTHDPIHTYIYIYIYIYRTSPFPMGVCSRNCV
jgi:hypothetical protein